MSRNELGVSQFFWKWQVPSLSEGVNDSEASRSKVVALVQSLETLQTFDKVATRYRVFFRIEEVYDRNGQEDVRNCKMRCAEVVQLTVHSYKFGDFVGCFDAFIFGMDIRVHQVDFEHRSKKMDDDTPIEHTRRGQHLQITHESVDPTVE